MSPARLQASPCSLLTGALSQGRRSCQPGMVGKTQKCLCTWKMDLLVCVSHVVGRVMRTKSIQTASSQISEFEKKPSKGIPCT